jgi:hypothetical protein
MKAKRKFDPKVIKQFFIDHTEKLVIGLVGLLFLYFTYSAVTLQVNESFKQTPKALADATEAAQATMTRGPVGKTPDKESPIRPYKEEIDKFKQPIDPKGTLIEIPFCVNVVSQPHLRPIPDVIPVMELRAVAGRGALSSRDNASGSVGQRWMLITGLVPNRAQAEEFHNKFKGAADDSFAEPTYAGFIVQRAEVPPGALGEPNWDKAVAVCNGNTFVRQMEKWNSVGSEVVDVQNTLPCLTSPLPPRMIGEWGDEVAHLPEIKLLPQEERMQGPGGQMAPGQMRPGQFPPGRFDRSMGPRGQTMFPGPGPRGTTGRGVTGEPMGPTGRTGGDSLTDDLLGGPTNAAREDPTKNNLNQAATQSAKYYLLRYYDFDVQPGKQYAYRVFAVVRNPNEGLPESVLADPTQSQAKFLQLLQSKEPADASGKVAGWGPADPKYWSQSCLSPRLPGDLRLLAGPVEPPKTPTPLEATGEARVLRWDDQTGFNSNYTASTQFRGTLLNYSDVAVKPSVEGRPKVPHLDTNCVLVDLAGGEALTPRDRDKVHSPGAMLVLDETGNLALHDEMSEAKEWTAETKELDRPNIMQERGPRGGFRGMPPGRGAMGPDPSLPDFGEMRGRPRGGR